jgi:hypothetical protein
MFAVYTESPTKLSSAVLSDAIVITKRNFLGLSLSKSTRISCYDGPTALAVVWCLALVRDMECGGPIIWSKGGRMVWSEPKLENTRSPTGYSLFCSLEEMSNGAHPTQHKELQEVHQCWPELSQEDHADIEPPILRHIAVGG